MYFFSSLLLFDDFRYESYLFMFLIIMLSKYKLFITTSIKQSPPHYLLVKKSIHIRIPSHTSSYLFLRNQLLILKLRKNLLLLIK